MPENEQKQENATFTSIRSQSYRSVYANQTQFGSTAFDFTMTFGEITDVSPDGSHVTVEHQVKVTMSPLHFKIFVLTAAQNVKVYEDKFGKINLPEGETVAPQDSKK
jgi:hypothetical protein